MTTFFLDLWHDLREKRLWPVAVGLLAAIVAVPVVLFKPASDAVPEAIAPPKANTADTLPVVAVEAGPIQGSRLEAFSEKNPFRPMKDLAKSAAGGSSNAPTTASTAGSGSTSGSAKGKTSTASSSKASTPGGGSTSSNSGGSGGSPATPSSGGGTPATPSAQWFHYTANFTFGEPGSPKKFKSASSFTLLPDDKKASIMFVGVTDDGKSAVFFISDPGFQAEGEGKCNATGAACRYVTLKLSDTSNEENFTALDGSVSYDLQLTGIQREAVNSSKATATPKASTKPEAGLNAMGSGVSTTTQTSESLLPDLLASGPGVLRVGG